MMFRRQLAVASPVSPSSLARALIASYGDRRALAHRAAEAVQAMYGAPSIALTDSGTSALVSALRLTVPSGGTVAYPGYACVDLAAAARFAGVKVRLYDLDPVTLAPDLDAIARVLERGVDAIVVAHLFAYPANVDAVSTLAARAGVPVIEDAAQGSGGTLGGKRLGSFGDLSVLSFGRGKGLCAGGGGAILGWSQRWIETIRQLNLATSARGLSAVATTAVQWALGRPSLYALPSALPWLHLGEMVYHPAHEPRELSSASAALIATAFALEPRAVEHRRRVAAALDTALAATSVARVAAVESATPGYLRYAVRCPRRDRRASPSLGIVQPYPRTLAEQPELTAVLVSGEPATLGAQEIQRSLFTLPTHEMVRERDVDALRDWLRGSGRHA